MPHASSKHLTKHKRPNYQSLMRTLDYHFRNESLLAEALTHRSFGLPNNERLEFIGDGILNYVIARMLFEQFPEEPEGCLSRMRANLVNQDALAKLAQRLQLGELLKLGEGEAKSGGKSRPSILADAVEALFAAVCLDADFAQAEGVVRKLFAQDVAQQNPSGQSKDAKTQLQEWLQARKLPLPDYEITSCEGLAHEQYFHVRCTVKGLDLATQGEGTSRRRAEQQAAQVALQSLLAAPK